MFVQTPSLCMRERVETKYRNGVSLSSVDQHISHGIFITHYDRDIFGVSIARNVCLGL